MNGISPYLHLSLSPATVSAAGPAVPDQPVLTLAAIDSSSLSVTVVTDQTETDVTVFYATDSDPGAEGSYPSEVEMTLNSPGQWTGVISGLSAEQTAYAKAVATNGEGDSTPDFDSATSNGVPPSAPSISGISWNSSVEAPAVSLNFSHSGGAPNFKLYRSTDGGSNYSEYTSGATIDFPGYSDTGVTAGNTYYYYLTNSNAWGESSPSAPVNITLS